MDQKTIIYLHGGGYVAGSPKIHLDIISRVAKVSKARTLTIYYRLAPEYPFSAALDDAFMEYNWLISSQGLEPNKIIVLGDSAGGGLVLSTLLKIRDNFIPLPAATVLLSPWTDLTCTRKPLKKFKLNLTLDQDVLKLCTKVYLNDENPRNPLASPLFANLEGLPPLYISVGTAEVLLDDALILANKADDFGLEVTLDIWEDMPHVFQAYAALTPEGKLGIQKIGDFIRKILK